MATLCFGGRCGLVVAVVALLESLAAQPAFRTSVDLVTIPVTVSARDQTRRIGELGVADFRVFEEDVRQEVSVVSHQPRALSVCILVDSSPSMATGRRALAIQSVDTLLGGLAPDDEAALVHFGSRVRVVLPWTRGAALLPLSWFEWRFSLGTALIDAMKEALRLIEQATNPQPVIVIVSDGDENASGTSLASLVSTRRQSETLIYGIDTDLPPSRMGPMLNRAFSDFLPALVGDSGGIVYPVLTLEAGQAAARALLDELRSQYTIGYVPTKHADGTYRRIRVEPADANLVMRHRGGYVSLQAR